MVLALHVEIPWTTMETLREELNIAHCLRLFIYLIY